MQTGSIGQFGDNVPQFVHGAPATVSTRPDLLDGFDQARRSVADDEPGRAESAADEIPTQIQPVLVRFTLTKPNCYEHAFTERRIPPGHQHALLVTTRPRGQI